MTYECLSPYLFRIMYFIGLWPKDWEETWKRKTYFIYSILMCILTTSYSVFKIMHSYMNQCNFEIFIESCFESSYSVYLTVQFYWSLLYWRKFQKTLESLKMIFLSEGDYIKPILEKTKKHERMLASFVVINGLITYVMVLDSVIIKGDDNSELNWNKTNPSRTLPIKLYLPFDETVSIYYEITFIHNILILTLTMVLFIIYTLLVPCIIIHINGQFQIICKILENWFDKDELYRIIRCEKTRKRYSARWSLKDLFKFHQQIIRDQNYLRLSNPVVLDICINYIWGFQSVSEETIQVLRSLAICKFTILSLIICLAVFQISLVPMGSYIFFQFTSYILISIAELYLLCLYGEELTKHSLQVCNAVYFSRWYGASTSDKKSLLLVMIRAQRPISLKLFPHFVPICIQSFISVMNASYSAFTLLTSLQTRTD